MALCTCCHVEPVKGADLVTSNRTAAIGVSMETDSTFNHTTAIGVNMETDSTGSESLQEEGPVEQPGSPSLQESQFLTDSQFNGPVRSSSDKRILSATNLHCEGVLRSTSIRSVLRRGGDIMRNSSGSASTYLLSKPARSIDIFVSHNWVVPRWKKFWALALHFNLLHAVVVAYACVAVGCLLNVMSVPPVLNYLGQPVRPHCEILGSCGFWLTLLFGHDLPRMQRLCCQPSLSIFLDKICIHQTDPELKAASINNLGAFLRHSKKMLVLFNPVYCKRLWTVYEMACYLYLHPRDQLELLPVGVASVVLKCAALTTVTYWFIMLLMHFSSMLSVGPAPMLILVSLIGAGLLCAVAVILRGWGLMQLALFSDLRRFQIARADCADESDRALIAANIGAFVRSMGLVEEECSDADALLSFDKLVQEQLPELLRSALGFTGFRYKYVLVANIGSDFFAFDILTSMQDISVQQAASWVLYNFMLRAAVFPCAFFICGTLGRAFRRRSGWAEVCVKCGIAFLAATIIPVLLQVADYFRQRALYSLSWLIALAALGLLLTVVVVALFSWRPRATDPAMLAVAARRSSTESAAV